MGRRRTRRSSWPCSAILDLHCAPEMAAVRPPVGRRELSRRWGGFGRPFLLERGGWRATAYYWQICRALPQPRGRR
jgi:hypothetical protein